MNLRRLDALRASVTKIAHNDIGFTEICCTLPNSRRISLVVCSGSKRASMKRTSHQRGL
jgi:hypothetical protein